MPQDTKIKEFPDVSNKLTAPSKKSLFERQKAEAEAKRQKEQEETAAVYEDFVKSFDDADDENDSRSAFASRGGFGSNVPSGGSGFSKRHFTGPTGGLSGRGTSSRGRGASGPGSLGPPPPSLTRKRPYDNGGLGKDIKQGLFAFEDAAPTDARAAFQASDDEEDQTSKSRAQERAAPKPTLHLSSLPPGTSPAAIKHIIPSTLTVDAVKILPLAGTSSTDRRSMSAIVTLAKDTPAGDMDTVVNSMQNKYLGLGFYLSISRHLSSAVVGSNLPAGSGLSNTALPFGAKPINMGPGGNFSRPNVSGPHRGGFAPPSSYGPAVGGGFNRGAPPVQVNVAPPSDLKQLKLIHKTLESLIAHGPEFEALLMSRTEVQKDERWAWIWDPRSVGGVWYRWRLWDIMTSATRRIKNGRGRNDASTQQVFDGGASWAAPEGVLPFEYTTSLNEFISDSDYDSSEDEDSGDEGRRRLHHLQGGAPLPEMAAPGEAELPAYLNPLQKAKLVHLLFRLPITTAKLRRGDVARITAFAISHAGSGADEVVSLLTTNIHRPFSLSTSADRDKPYDEDDDYEPPTNPTFAKPALDQEKDKEKEDPSPSKLIALYLLSDILSTSSTSGVRHAWRYRSLFEASLRTRHAFAHLGRLEKDLRWGRLRAEKWRRSVSGLLGLWEGWCVFPAKAQEEFVEEFANPPLTREEKEVLEKEEEERRAKERGKGKWKAVKEREGGNGEEGDRMEVDGEEIEEDEDVDGEVMEEGDVDGEPMEEEEDLDGEPMMEADGDGAEIKNEEGSGSVEEASAAKEENPLADDGAPPTRRRRPKAEDMFADPDGE